MRLQTFSDLHTDVRPTQPITVTPDIDAVIVAGDICEGAERGFEFLRQFVRMQIPILFVFGNHELYKRVWSEEIARARATAPLYAIHVLENDIITFGGVRFVGATLWTDYALFGRDYAPLAMRCARDGMNDHRLIIWSKKPWQRFRPQEALKQHQHSRAFIEAALAKPFDGDTVVVTHHAPHPNSIHPRYRDDLLSAAFVSDLTEVIEAGRPALWVHGHVHSSFDYRIGSTRVVCNPHGYGAENPEFDAALVLEGVGS